MRNGIGLRADADIAAADVIQNATLTIGGESRPNSDIVRLQLADGYSIWVVGSNFSINNNSSYQGPLDGDDSFTGGTVHTLFGLLPGDGNEIYARIEGISATLAEVGAAAMSDSNADEAAIIQREFSGADTFDLSNSADYAFGFGGGDEMNGDGGNDGLVGGEGNDIIDGGSGNDSLFGGNGRDQLFAGTGQDQLTGGAGRDQFYGGTDTPWDLFAFLAVGDSRADDVDNDGQITDDIDVIRNFTRDNADGTDDNDGDILFLEQIDLRPGQTGDQDFAWGGEDGAAARSVWWSNVTGGIVVYGDTNGDTEAEIAIFVRGIGSIAREDIDL